MIPPVSKMAGGIFMEEKIMFMLGMMAYMICGITAIYYKWKKKTTDMIFWLFLALMIMITAR